MMSKPFVGISMTRDWIGHRRIHAVSQSYQQAVIRAGGVPVLLPIGMEENDSVTMLSRLQGLIVTGGPDINPARYGGSMHPSVTGVDPLRDETDIDLVKSACDLGLPLLAICRGIQVINVAFGGTLYTDVNQQQPGGMYHTFYPSLPFDLQSHKVYLEKDGRVARILGRDEIEVNSLHHQGIRRLGEGLQVTAKAPDGLVEGVEIQGHPFGLGVQWHPELMPEDIPSQRLFAALISAAEGKG
jgi:putative glutamine amidotransferase